MSDAPKHHTVALSGSLADLPAAILVGGLGTRLKSVVSDRPKPLAEVAGRPFLDRLLDQLAAAGVQRVVLLTGHMGNVVAERYGAQWGPLTIAYSHETSPLGTGGALKLALENESTTFENADSLLLLNGDSYVDVDLNRLCAAHRACGGATLTIVEVPDTSRFGRVECTGDRITRFTEKGSTSGPGWINAGVYLIDRRLATALPQGPSSLEQAALPLWAQAGELNAFTTSGRFIDIGTPQTFNEGQTFFQ